MKVALLEWVKVNQGKSIDRDGAYGAYELYSGKISKGLGSEVLATLCVFIGLFSRKSESKDAQDS